MPSSETVPVDLRVAPPRVLRGRVLHGQHVLSGAQVRLRGQALAETCCAEWFETRSGDDGRFVLPCPDVEGLVLEASSGELRGSAVVGARGEYELAVE